MLLCSENITISKIIDKLSLFIIFFMNFVVVFFISIYLLQEYKDLNLIVSTYITDIKIFMVIILLLALFSTLIIYKFPYSFIKKYTLKTLEFINRINPENGIKLTIRGAIFCILFSFIIWIFSQIFLIDKWYSSLFINFTGIFLVLSFYYIYTSTKKLIDLDKALIILEEIDSNYKSFNEINNFRRHLKLGLNQIELKLQKDCSLKNIKLNARNYKVDDFIQHINNYLFYGGKEAKEEIKIFIINIKNNINGPKVNGTLLLKNISEIDNKMTSFFNKNSMNLTKPFSFGSSLIDLIKNSDINKIIALIFTYVIIYYINTMNIQFP